MNLQDIDRRIMYILLGAVVALPLVWDVIRQPLEISSEVQGVYDAVERIPKGKIAIISVVWGAGTRAENRPQTEVVATHLFRRGIPFIIVPWDQQGTTLSYNAVEQIAKKMGKEYGKHWISTGFRPSGYMPQIIQSMAVNIPSTFEKDVHGTPFRDIPMIRGVKTARDVGMVLETTPSDTVGFWIAFMGQPYKVPIAHAPTGVMVPEGYNFLDAKQIVGMLPGLIGAAKYEQMLGYRGFALRASNSLSTSHVLIILLIILGNLGYFISRRQRRAGR